MEDELHVEVNHPPHGGNNAGELVAPLGLGEGLGVPDDDLGKILLRLANGFPEGAPALVVLEAPVGTGGQE